MPYQKVLVQPSEIGPLWRSENLSRKADICFLKPPLGHGYVFACIILKEKMKYVVYYEGQLTHL